MGAYMKNNACAARGCRGRPQGPPLQSGRAGFSIALSHCPNSSK
jgi:hypothetical protein